MKKCKKAAVVLALSSLLVSVCGDMNVYAASSVFPAAGGALATGNGISMRDIRANAARSAAKSTTSPAQKINNAILSGQTSTGETSASENAAAPNSADASAQNDIFAAVAKVQTPASMAVNEGLIVNGVSVVGSASEAAQMEVVSTASNVTNAEDAKAAVEAQQAADGEIPTIEVAPDVEIAEGEEDLSREVIAQVSNYVNVRSEASEDSEVVGKLYNHSAGTWLDKQGDWVKIESGNVTGFVKGEFVVTGEAAVKLAAEVGERVATVTTTTLKIREEATTNSAVLGLIPMDDRLTVLEETDEWAKVAIEEGDGWVSKEYLSITTEFPKAESKAEEEARLAKEEEDRRKAQEAARKAQKKNQATPSAPKQQIMVAASGSGYGSQVANFALQFVGNPYVYGGTSLTNGADCSGFTLSVFKNFGVSLPHSAGAQRAYGTVISSVAEAQPGDLFFYSGHVGIYIGNGMIVHASTTKTGIKVSNATYRTVEAIRRIF